MLTSTQVEHSGDTEQQCQFIPSAGHFSWEKQIKFFRNSFFSVTYKKSKEKKKNEII